MRLSAAAFTLLVVSSCLGQSVTTAKSGRFEITVKEAKLVVSIGVTHTAGGQAKKLLRRSRVSAVVLCLFREALRGRCLPHEVIPSRTLSHSFAPATDGLHDIVRGSTALINSGRTTPRVSADPGRVQPSLGPLLAPRRR
jgi:hypothetical protein